jgi:TonB family protein
MKKSIKIFALLAILAVVQSCASKEKKTDGYVENETPTVTAPIPTLTVEEKRANNEKKRIALAEKRRLEFEARIKITPFYTDENKNVVYNKAEIDPTFAGGEEAMHKYLQENMKYPEQAEKDALEGTVFVDFIVVANGSVRDVMASDAPGEEADQSLRDEAIRVVSNMPKWVPGRQHGKPVDVKFSLPITFRMI